jgi:hypothetical protein
MKMKYVGLVALIGFFGLGAATASADTATFASAPATGCPYCTATDTTGLTVTALGHLLPNGWDVRAGNYALYLNNHDGAVFTLPGQNFPGKSFDLTGLKLFATNRATSTTAPVTYTLYAFHFGNPIADVVQITINSRVISDVPLTDPRLLDIDTLVVRPGLEVGYTYFVETRFTPH